VVNDVINRNLSRIEQKELVKFGPLTPEITWLMFTYPKSSVRVQCNIGHVTLPSAEFHPHEFSTQSDIGRRADSRWTLPQISSSFIIFIYHFLIISLLYNRLVYSR